MEKNIQDAFDKIEKSIRPEISKEQLGMVIEHLMEAIESIIETPEENSAESETESEDSAIEIEDANPDNPAPIGDPDKNPINWPIAKSNNLEDDEEISKNYESDNEEEDKWDNVEKACWTGYTQRGMKEKNGRMVPNCVPVEKVNKSIWDGKFNPSNFTK
jgi:hypothetical protein